MASLRAIKAEAALLIALADIGNVWPVARITAGAHRHRRRNARRGGPPSPRRGRPRAASSCRPTRSNPDAASGYIVLAMGKMGAHELNFSSDIDLMVFFDPAAAALAPDVEPTPFFVRLTRELVKLMQERTADGYVFRVDLRLRPDPSSTQIAISTDAALDYYESRGQNWERAALIKARACAGDLAAGEKLLRELSPFIWRKYLDYAAVADVHEMKQHIHAYRGHGEIAVEGHNVKLGRGGIREIEFFVQTQQLIAGGRHHALRGRGTLAMLARLAADGWIDDSRARRTRRGLRFPAPRRASPADGGGRADPHACRPSATRSTASPAFSALPAATNSPPRSRASARGRAALCPAVRAPAGAARRAAELSFVGPEGDGETLDRLAEMGFRQPREVAAAVRRWREGLYRGLRGEQTREILTAMAPAIVDRVRASRSARTRRSSRSTAFSPGCAPAGAFVSLLRQHPELSAFSL